jgi:hypothetical protein
MRDALAAVDRSVTPWLILHGHRVAYVDSDYVSPVWGGDVNDMAVYRQYVEPLALRYGVDVHVAGHRHVTQRQCATRAGVCVQNSTLTDGVGVYDNPGAPVYYVIGSAGADASNADCWVTGVNFTAWQTGKNGFAQFTAVSPSVLEVRIVDPRTGRVLDATRILAYSHAPAATPNVWSTGTIVGFAVSFGLVAVTLLGAAAWMLLASQGGGAAAAAAATAAPAAGAIAIAKAAPAAAAASDTAAAAAV